MSSSERPASTTDDPAPHGSSRAWEPDPLPAPRPRPRRVPWTASLRWAPLLRWLRRLPGRALHPATLRDRALVRRIHASLALAHALDDLGQVRLYVAHGTVTLAGRIATDDLRDAVVRRVHTVRGVREVEADTLFVG